MRLYVSFMLLLTLPVPALASSRMGFSTHVAGPVSGNVARSSKLLKRQNLPPAVLPYKHPGLAAAGADAQPSYLDYYNQKSQHQDALMYEQPQEPLPQNQTNGDSKKQQIMQALASVLSGLSGGGAGANPSGYQPTSLGGGGYIGGGGPGGYDMSGPVLTGSGLVAGLCSDENRNTTQVQRGWCRTIYEELTNETTCSNKILRELASMSAPNGMPNFCSSFDQMKRDPHTHALFWQNLIAALVMEESGWKPGTVGDQGKSKGLLQLSETDRSYGCSCANLNSSNIHDPHVNLRCGTYIILKNVRRDMEMGRGSVRNGTALGIARYFGPFNDHQKEKRSKIAQKSNNWCVARSGSGSRQQVAGTPTIPGG